MEPALDGSGNRSYATQYGRRYAFLFREVQCRWHWYPIVPEAFAVLPWRQNPPGMEIPISLQEVLLEGVSVPDMFPGIPEGSRSFLRCVVSFWEASPGRQTRNRENVPDTGRQMDICHRGEHRLADRLWHQDPSMPDYRFRVSRKESSGEVRIGAAF